LSCCFADDARFAIPSAVTPDHVKHLIDNYKGDKLTGIYVQPSQRIFPDSQYEKAGAIIQEDLSNADVLLGVKRVANEDDLIPDKTYMFFSHVIKGQSENMKLLKVIQVYILNETIRAALHD